MVYLRTGVYGTAMPDGREGIFTSIITNRTVSLLKSILSPSKSGSILLQKVQSENVRQWVRISNYDVT